MSEILDQRGDGLRQLVGEIAAAAAAAEERGHQAFRTSGRRYLDRASVERESTRLFAQTASLARKYPADPGVLVTLLLNHVVLSPGEAMFLDAGVVHAYSSGFGVEIMASSDNVVRAGLTPEARRRPRAAAHRELHPDARAALGADRRSAPTRSPTGRRSRSSR